MSSIFQHRINTDNNLIYTILNNNQGTLDLSRMRSVCRKWREIVDYISRDLMRSLGIKADLGSATFHVIQITSCFNSILGTKFEIEGIEELSRSSPLETVTQIPLIIEAFAIKDNSYPIVGSINLTQYRKYIDCALKSLSKKQKEHSRVFKAVLINLSRHLPTAAMFNSEEAFFHIYNYYFTNDSDYQEALEQACKIGNYTMIHTLLDIGANPKVDISERQSYLTACCNSLCVRGVQLLLSKGADPNRRNELGEKPIAIAARASKKIFDIILEKREEDLKERYGADKDIILEKLKEELNERYGADNDKTLAHFAAEGNNEKVIYRLHCADVNIDAANIRGVTPLMIAIRESSEDAFEALIECGASLTKRCENQYTPLDYSVIVNNEKFIKILLARTNDDTILLKACKTAAKHSNNRALKLVTESLGISSQVKYTLVLGAGFIVGGIISKYLGSRE